MRKRTVCVGVCVWEREEQLKGQLLHERGEREMQKKTEREMEKHTHRGNDTHRERDRPREIEGMKDIQR